MLGPLSIDSVLGVRDAKLNKTPDFENFDLKADTGKSTITIQYHKYYRKYQ